MNALIILAHGSRRQESNLEIQTLAEKVTSLVQQDDQSDAKQQYHLVDYAYLEVTAPTLLQAIDASIQQGASQITVMPYFLNSGNHVMRDIPAMINQARAQYPTCEFNLSACIGMLDNMPALVLAQANKI